MRLNIDYIFKVEKTKKRRNFNSYKDSRYGLIDNPVNGCTMRKVLCDFGIPDNHIVVLNKGRHAGKINLYPLDVIIVSQDIVSHTKILQLNAHAIQDYVKGGGIFWIMHQPALYWETAWPSFSPFANIHLVDKYVDREYTPEVGYKEYVGPWIMQKNHPLWNKPNYLDEGNFVFWNVDIDGKSYQTAATSVVLVERGWDIIARFADDRTLDKVALVLETKNGKGLYFWTQLFSPQAVWRKKCFEKMSWKLFLENILTYFKDFKENRVLEVKVSSDPWSLAAGNQVRLIVRTRGEETLSKITVGVKNPDGSQRNILVAKKGKNIYQAKYKPSLRGEYQVKVCVRTKSGREGVGHTFFKVSKGWTPYRFLTHVHTLEWSEASPGLIYGACRRLGIDGVILSQVRQRALSPKDISLIDNSLVRFFFGMEFHTYRFPFQHFLAFKLPKDAISKVLDTYKSDVYDPAWLRWVHERGGIAIVAHSGDDTFWMDQDFDGIELERTERRNWDAKLKEGKFLFGAPTADNQGVQMIKANGVGIAWIKDKPFTLKTLIDACRNGRVVKVGTWPCPLRATKYNYLWFDIDGQTGGTVYSRANVVKLHIKAKSLTPINRVKVIRDGNVIENIKLEKRIINITISQRVTADTYFRVEIHPPEGCGWQPSHRSGESRIWRNIWFTNPIFCKMLPSKHASPSI